jgi:hypothetical protein
MTTRHPYNRRLQGQRPRASQRAPEIGDYIQGQGTHPAYDLCQPDRLATRIRQPTFAFAHIAQWYEHRFRACGRRESATALYVWMVFYVDRSAEQ